MIFPSFTSLLALAIATSVGQTQAHIPLNDDGSLSANFVKKAKLAAKISLGIYFGDDYDPTRLDINPSYTHFTQVYEGNAVVHWQYKTCFVGFKGMGSNVDSLSDARDEANEHNPKVKNSGFTKIFSENTGTSCAFNEYLLEDWKTDHLNSQKSDNLFAGIEYCMEECDKTYGKGTCRVLYTGHSQGGAEAMATAHYLEDRWFHKLQPPTIITFGQPGTFFGGNCRTLRKWAQYMYRFTQLKGYYSFGNKISYDPAPAVGGNHMGHTIFLTSEDRECGWDLDKCADSNRVKLYRHEDRDSVYYGPVISDFNSSDKSDNNALKAHSIMMYKTRIEYLNPSKSNGRIYTTGFDKDQRCDKSEHCKNSCSSKKCT